MANEVVTSETAASAWRVKQVYALAVVCLVIGVAVGYLFRGSRSPAPPENAMRAAAPAGTPAGMSNSNMSNSGAMSPHAAMGSPPPTLDQMKHMADKKAEPLLARLKGDPKNADLMIEIGRIYFSTHQFKDAADYFAKSLEVKPKNTPIRTQLASCLYYVGDVDGALQQLVRATADDPKDADSLFNLGMVRWRAKKDSKGALSAWAQLLKANPQLDPAKRAQVEKLMAEVRQGSNAN